jgi:hypothetical protein
MKGWNYDANCFEIEVKEGQYIAKKKEDSQ